MNDKHIKNRLVLFDGLLKLGKMSLGGYQRRMPAVQSATFESESNIEFTISIGGKNINILKKAAKDFKGVRLLLRGMKAGTPINIIKAEKETSLSWKMSFAFSNGESISINGNSTGDKAAGSFIVPLPNKWKYSKTAQETLSLSTSILNVSNYPNCIE